MKQVTLAYPLERDGKKHRPDTTISLPDAEADRLVFDGLARAADKTDKEGK